MGLIFELGAKHNQYLQDFVATSAITSKVVATAIQTCEAATIAQLLAKCSTLADTDFGNAWNPAEYSAALINSNLLSASGKTWLRMHASGEVQAEQLKANDSSVERVLTQLAHGPSLEVIARFRSNAIASTQQSSALSEAWSRIEDASDEAATEFVRLMCDFGPDSAYDLPVSQKYKLLCSLRLGNFILHPFGLWRGLYPGSGEGTPQRYLDLSSKPLLVGSALEADLNSLQDELAEGKNHPEVVTRLTYCYLMSTTERLADCDPKALLALLNSYLSHEVFRKRKTQLISGAKNDMSLALRAISHHLVAAGNASAVQLSHRAALVNGYNLRKDRGSKGDGTYEFLEEAGLPTWGSLFKEYNKSAAVTRKMSVVNTLLPACDWLLSVLPQLESPSQVRRSDLVRTGSSIRTPTLKEYLLVRYGNDSGVPNSVFGRLRSFFEWFQREKSPECVNPVLSIDYPPQPGFDGKTTKNSLPVKIIEMMKVILTEDDWAWPKKFQADYGKFYDEASGEAVTIWSPVRAGALHLMLWLPIRTIQCRLLDSGEFDSECFDSDTRNFTKNNRAIPGRMLGALRCFTDPRDEDNRSFIGTYINSNKTGVLFAGTKRQGYEIKWERKEVVDTISMVRDWQVRFNPIPEPIALNDLQDKTLHAPDAVAALIPKYAFLFRDPCSARASAWEPISHSRLSTLFVSLCAEAERRLQALGQDVTLIDAWDKSADGSPFPASAIVTLHSLRVSGITNFAEFGVPLSILTEFLAGHSSILMNIWYQKFGFAYVNDVIQRAHANSISGESVEQMRRWIDDQVDSAIDDTRSIGGVDNDHQPFTQFHHRLNQYFAAGSAEALDTLSTRSSGLWSIDIDGICPNGRTACSEGGPIIGTKGWTRKTPVPGGRGNCPRCRFWVTGALFLAGQVVKSNLLLFDIQEKGVRLAELEDKLDDLQVNAKTDPSPRSDIARIRGAMAVLEDEIDGMLHTWVRRYEYAVKSAALPTLTDANGSARHQLLVHPDGAGASSLRGAAEVDGGSDLEGKQPASGVSVRLQMGDPLELLEFVNRACELIPSASSPTAVLRKSKLLDALLNRESGQAFFFKLTDEECLKAGNAMTKFLCDLVGHHGTLELMAGRKALADFGIEGMLEGADSLVTRAKRVLIDGSAQR